MQAKKPKNKYLIAEVLIVYILSSSLSDGKQDVEVHLG